MNFTGIPNNEFYRDLQSIKYFKITKIMKQENKSYLFFSHVSEFPFCPPVTLLFLFTSVHDASKITGFLSTSKMNTSASSNAA
jgi:hypothetical protein